MKHRIARKVIKYGMEEVRGRYGTYLKAYNLLPSYVNFLRLKRIMKPLRDIYGDAARPDYQATTGRVFHLGTPDGTATIADGESMLMDIKGKTLHTKTITYGPKGIGKSRLSSSIWD